MAKYVPLNDNDIAAIKRARDGYLYGAEIGDHTVYQDCIRLDEILASHERLDDHDPLAAVDQFRSRIIEHLRDMAAVAQEHQTEGTTDPADEPIANGTQTAGEPQCRSSLARGQEAANPPAAPARFLIWGTRYRCDNCGDICHWFKNPEGEVCDACGGDWVLVPGRPSFSDPGDGYDSAIRWHADFERGDLA